MEIKIEGDAYNEQHLQLKAAITLLNGIERKYFYENDQHELFSHRMKELEDLIRIIQYDE